MSKKIYERPFIQQLNTGSMNKFGTRTEFGPVDHIDNVSVKNLIMIISAMTLVVNL